jgi:hypothetical protein
MDLNFEYSDYDLNDESERFLWELLLNSENYRFLMVDKFIAY